MRFNLKQFYHFLIYTYVFVIGVLSIYMAELAINAEPKAKVYCSLAEISPDFSVAQRERCRTIRSRKL